MASGRIVTPESATAAGTTAVAGEAHAGLRLAPVVTAPHERGGVLPFSGYEGLSPEELDYLVARYDDEIAYWDEQFGVLLWALSKGGLLERTAIAVVADHGEQFLEHEHLKHCRTLYDVELRVPLVFFVPGVSARRVAAPAANLDLVPTVLDLLGAPAPAELEGRSLRRELTGRPPKKSGPGPIHRAWWNGERAVMDGRYKLVVSPAWRTPRLFDLVEDPGERTNLGATDRANVVRMRRAIADWVREEPYVAGSDEVTKRLKALGYLQ